MRRWARSGCRAAARAIRRRPGPSGYLADSFKAWLQPRYVMGMAMTILSFSMLARFAHIEPRQLRPSDLDPVKVWQGIDDHSHRVYDRAMKYYDNLRLVIEIQSRLKEWTDQDPSQNGAAQGVRTSAQPDQRKR